MESLMKRPRNANATMLAADSNARRALQTYQSNYHAILSSKSVSNVFSPYKIDL
jgi:hypothetical protein